MADVAPDFEARSARVAIRLSGFRGRLARIFFHPANFSPVCATEFVASQKLRGAAARAASYLDAIVRRRLV